MTEKRRTPDADVESVASSLRHTFTGLLKQDSSLGGQTSLKVGGSAALLAQPENESDLLTLSSVLRKHRVPCLVLGRGTNVLLSDAGWPGIVIRLGRGFEWIRGEDKIVEAGGATPLPQVANWAARRSMAGMEFAIAIPASVGGAVRMNAGAHLSEVGDVLVSARICRLQEGRVEVVSSEMLEMAYRSTVVGDQDIVCSAMFQLREGSRETISALMREHRAHRLSTQPADQANAGSCFSNPPGATAGELIESSGLKGARIGGAEVSRKHANFLVAHAGASAQDVYDLMAKVQSAVFERTGVMLSPEVRIVGPFDTSRGEVRFA